MRVCRRSDGRIGKQLVPRLVAAGHGGPWHDAERVKAGDARRASGGAGGRGRARARSGAAEAVASRKAERDLHQLTAIGTIDTSGTWSATSRRPTACGPRAPTTWSPLRRGVACSGSWRRATTPIYARTGAAVKKRDDPTTPPPSADAPKPGGNGSCRAGGPRCAEHGGDRAALRLVLPRRAPGITPGGRSRDDPQAKVPLVGERRRPGRSSTSRTPRRRRWRRRARQSQALQRRRRRSRPVAEWLPGPGSDAGRQEADARAAIVDGWPPARRAS